MLAPEGAKEVGESESETPEGAGRAIGRNGYRIVVFVRSQKLNSNLTRLHHGRRYLDHTVGASRKVIQGAGSPGL